METIEISIPAADFNFSEMAKIIAREVCEDDLGSHGIMVLNNNQLDNYSKLDLRLRIILNDFASKGDKLVYLKEIIGYLINKEIQLKSAITSERHKSDMKLQYERAKYYFYKQLDSIGYNLDKNAFTIEEIVDFNSKLNDILQSLEILKNGNYALGAEIQELKDDLNELKSEYILGKKTWKQKATGVIFSFVGKKGAEEVYKIIKPHLKDFLFNQAPDVLQKLLH